MNEKEKEAIIKLRHYIDITAYWKQEEYTNSEVDNYIKIILNLISKLQKREIKLNELLSDREIEVEGRDKKIDKLQKENEEIRQWKYVIDTVEDLDKLKDLDVIKIKGKIFINEDKIKNIVEKSYNDVDYFNRDIRRDIEKLIEN